MLLSTQNLVIFRMLLNIMQQYIRDDGTFACRAGLYDQKQELRIEMENEGKTKTAIRRFRLRP